MNSPLFLRGQEAATIAPSATEALGVGFVADPQFGALAAALHAFAIGVCIYDVAGRLVLRSSSVEQVHGGALDCTDRLRRLMARGAQKLGRSQFGSSSRGAQRDAFEWLEERPDGKRVRIRLKRLRDGWASLHEFEDDRLRFGDATFELSTLQSMIDVLPDCFYVKDRDGRFVFANRSVANDFGFARGVDLVGGDDFDAHSPETATEHRRAEIQIMESGRPMVDREDCIVTASGETKWYSTTKTPYRDFDGNISGIIGIARNITARKKAAALRDGQAQVLEMLATGAELSDVMRSLVLTLEAHSPGVVGALTILEPDGVHFRIGAAPNMPAIFHERIREIRVGPDGGFSGVVVFRNEFLAVSDIREHPAWANFREVALAIDCVACWAAPIPAQSGEPIGAFTLYSRASRRPDDDERRLLQIGVRIAAIAIEKRRAEDRIRFMATHDDLTGLPNRTLLRERLEQAKAYARTHSLWATIVYVDLDNFKSINDAHGHSAGDDVLKIVAMRLKASVEAADTVVRLGGDEFVLLFWGQARNADAVAARLRAVRAALAQPCTVGTTEIRLTGSLGVASYPDDGEDAESLLAAADAAMYRAKENGRDDFHFYTAALNREIRERIDMESALGAALSRGEFHLLYQPQCDLVTGRIFGVEALLRWRRPGYGIVAPGDFIGLAEESGLIVPLGDWVLHEACRRNKSWTDAGLPPITVSVNVSARQFRDARLVERVTNALQASGLEPNRLELELTETLIMQHPDRAKRMMGELTALGVGLAIDDFGTGYSSLSALRDFPVARLKIDGSFVRDLATCERDRAVTAAIVSLARKLQMKVIAECVETAEQISTLEAQGCREAQGYFFGRPAEAEAVAKMLAGRPAHDD